MAQCPYSQNFSPYLQCDSEEGHKARSHVNFTYDVPTFWYAPTIGELIEANGARWDAYTYTADRRVWNSEEKWWEYERSDLPSAGDDIWISDLTSTLDPYSGKARRDAPDFYEFPVTFWGDYCGSSVDRSNYRSLLEEYPHAFLTMSSGYNGNALLIRADYAGDDAEDLFNIGEKLRDDYPLYSEEDHSLLEFELAEEAWDAYMSMDLTHDLMRRGINTDRISDDDIRKRFYADTFCGEYGEYPYYEGAYSVVFPNYKDTLEVLVNHYRLASRIIRTRRHRRNQRKVTA